MVRDMLVCSWNLVWKRYGLKEGFWVGVEGLIGG